MSGSTETILRERVSTGKTKMSEIHTWRYNGVRQRRSPTTQTNVTVANQFTVKLQQAPKASRKNTCISFIYHSYRAIPIFFASRSSTCTPINFITRMNKFISWQTNGPQDHNIILNQLLDHPFKLQKNLRQRSFIVASEWLQESVSRTCFPVRTKDPFSAAMRINLHHHCRQNNNHNSKD